MCRTYWAYRKTIRLIFHNQKEKVMRPFIYERTKDGEVMYDVFSRLVKDRIVFLEGEIDSDIATTISATLLFLAAQDPNKLISLLTSTFICPA